MTTSARKQSYTIPCSSAFRDSLNGLAEKRRVNVADLARSALLLVPDDLIRGFPDPGGPPPGDREQTVLKSGPSEGRPWRRKPRLQVRLRAGYDVSTVRRALNLMLALDRGDHMIAIEDPNAPNIVETALSDEDKEEMERLRAMVSVMAFNPLQGGVTSRAEALHVMGFAPNESPARDIVRARFRMLATIHHPDSNYGNHQRMSQLNAAMDVLNG
jgi:hypothetical protein